MNLKQIKQFPPYDINKAIKSFDYSIPNPFTNGILFACRIYDNRASMKEFVNEYINRQYAIVYDADTGTDDTFFVELNFDFDFMEDGSKSMIIRKERVMSACIVNDQCQIL